MSAPVVRLSIRVHADRAETALADLLPLLGRGRTGDLRVVVNVAVPRRLTSEQRDLLEKLAGTITEDNLRSDEGMFAKIKRALAG